MKSIGIDINGKELVFEGERVSCENNHLTSLVLNEGCKVVWCDNIDLFSVKPDIEINILNFIK